MVSEIEAKFMIPDAGVSRRLKRLRRLAGFRLGERKVVRVLDTYLDTQDRLLLAAGVACRVRRQDDGQVWLTLKEMGAAKGAVHRREELEFLLPADESGSRGMFAARGWPEGPVRTRVLQVVGRKRLIRLATIRQRRTIRPIAQDGHTVALLSLDDVQVRAGGAVERFAEVEVELTGRGGNGGLNRLASCLEQEWGLRPETRSKLERAVALADARPKTPPSRKALGIDPAASMAEAARRILRKQLGRMVAHERGTRDGRDIEELHDMRVAVRRMRAALRVFRRYLDMTAYKPFRKTLRRTGRTLGMVRDLDVFREKAQRYLDGLPVERRSELDPLLAAWQTAHARARKAMLDLLNSKAHAQFKKEFARFLATAGAGAPPAPPEGDAPLPDRVREAVPLLVVGSYAAVRAYEGRVEGKDTPMPRLHQLRIAAKRLRYTLEFFREILPTEAEALIDRIKGLQEHLGNLQDAVVTCGNLRDFLTWGTWGDHRTEGAAATGVVVAPGVATYLSVRQAELQRLVKGFPAVWKKVSGEDFRRQLFAAVTGL
ncbi:MAG: CHAD domain-containing protein [Candidatus Methylomirabilota bacterium]